MARYLFSVESLFTIRGRGIVAQPGVAAAMPTVSRDGRTYTFLLRPGSRFSPPSNEPVTAETFRYTIERTLSPDAQDSYYAPAIVGMDPFAKAVKAHRPAHIAVISALVAHLVADWDPDEWQALLLHRELVPR